MSSPEENAGPVIRDLRRIDPATGQVRELGQPGTASRGPGKPRPGKHAASKPGAGGGSRRSPEDETAAGPQPAAGPAAGQPEAERQEQESKLAERTADLQRVTAEYANYRKRVERDRHAVREQALANVLAGLLPVLDDLGRAAEHGELVGGFKSVADSLESAVTKLGLQRFGEEGEPFDPNVHEALMHSYSSDVTEPTCIRILQPGYRIGDRVLRPARVAVAEPGEADGEGPAEEAAAGDGAAEPQESADTN